MANTLKFGNGEWYGKKDTILAYNDENSNYKPLPFDFSRASSATVINKDGLIETVGSGQPRIDYKDDSKGALKLEPQRTNLVTYSEDFADAYWGKGSTTVSSNASISLDGTLNADLIYPNASGTTKFSVGIDKVTSGLSTSERINSVFVKSNNWQWIYLLDPSGFKSVWFDVINGVVGTQEANSVGTIEDYGNGWFRCSISSHSTSVNYNYTGVYFSDANGSSVCTNNSTDGVYLCGAQVEEGSYATSYIPTQGSAVTRLRDECLKDDFSILTVGNSYTLFFDVDLNEKDDNKTFFNIENTSAATSFTVRSVLGGVIRVYNNLDSQYPTGNLASSTSKWVVRIDGTSFKIFGAEGSLSGTLTTARDMGEGIFGRYSQTKINDFKVYNTALSDSECEALTQV